MLWTQFDTKEITAQAYWELSSSQSKGRGKDKIWLLMLFCYFVQGISGKQQMIIMGKNSKINWGWEVCEKPEILLGMQKRQRFKNLCLGRRQFLLILFHLLSHPFSALVYNFDIRQCQP